MNPRALRGTILCRRFSMRLIKLAAYALLGYIIYELYRGMTEGQQQMRGAGGRSWRRRGDLERALNEDTGRMNVTGTGRGTTTVSTEDATGARSRHVVGRGVISTRE
jgi:hypothetical protein